MQQSVIIHRERINRAGEMKYFQIPLPGTEKKVIGVETSIFLLTALPAPVPDGGSSTNEPSPSCPNPGNATMTELSNQITADPIRIHVFQIGNAVNPTFQYSVAVYSVTVAVIAVGGDTPATIVTKLADAVNNTTLAEWNQFGSNDANYKPTASANADQLTLTCDINHQFAAWATGSCTGAPPPPSGPVYDPLFVIKNNDKAGVLSLQSPDRTDIFYQGEVFREDHNLRYGDYTSKHFFEIEQWITGKRRFSAEVLITTHSPLIEAYYKDEFGVLYRKEISYLLNIFVWLQKP
ncbi:hypothetical protein [Longitalea luteola]|uniref:hypothetical protein n=1 Tax=Longitalea luteola TaxID=2812563 RepID=UPI001A96FB3A|nr:hypothetical protein [Longitalea luteola]